MESYTKEQKEVLELFYLACRKKGFDPRRSAADKQRALLLVDNDTYLSIYLKEIFGGKLDKAKAAEAYCAGKEYSKEKEDAAKAAEQEAIRAELRRQDKAYANEERRIAKLRERDKREFFLEETIKKLDLEIEQAQRDQKESSRKDELSDDMQPADAVDPLYAQAVAREEAAQSKKAKLKREQEKIKYHLLEEIAPERIDDMIRIEKTSIAYADSGTMMIRVDLCSKQKNTIADIDAVIDGAFLAEVYDGDTLVGTAWLNMPRDGLAEKTTLYARCMNVEKEGNYSLLILPEALWMIEKYDLSSVTPVCDVSSLCAFEHPEELQWKTASLRSETWQERKERKQQEEEEKRRKEAEQTQKEETERKKREEEYFHAMEEMERKSRFKFLSIALLVIAVLVFIAVLFTKIIPDSKYNAAVTLMEEGRYDEAIPAFVSMIWYGDSLQKIDECKHGMAMDMLVAGDYDSAYTLLEELGKHEVIESSKYERATALLDAGDYESAYTLLRGISYKDSADRLLGIKQVLMQKAAVGDIVRFGAYEQDGDPLSGKEDIQWLVLAKEENRVLLISSKGLECQPFNASHGATWETCSLRKWLNDTFLKAAFREEEQSVIPDTVVSADPNPSFATNPGNATTDKVFLLSIAEVNQYFGSNEARKCAPSIYAKSQGVWTNDSYQTASGEATCRWWLRSPGGEQAYAANVGVDGSVNYYGGDDNADFDLCVRPALWVKLGE